MWRRCLAVSSIRPWPGVGLSGPQAIPVRPRGALPTIGLTGSYTALGQAVERLEQISSSEALRDVVESIKKLYELLKQHSGVGSWSRLATPATPEATPPAAPKEPILVDDEKDKLEAIVSRLKNITASTSSPNTPIVTAVPRSPPHPAVLPGKIDRNCADDARGKGASAARGNTSAKYHSSQSAFYALALVEHNHRLAEGFIPTPRNLTPELERWPPNLWCKVGSRADNPSLSLCPVNYKLPPVERHRCNDVGTWLKNLVDRKNDAPFFTGPFPATAHSTIPNYEPSSAGLTDVDRPNLSSASDGAWGPADLDEWRSAYYPSTRPDPFPTLSRTEKPYQINDTEQPGWESSFYLMPFGWSSTSRISGVALSCTRPTLYLLHLLMAAVNGDLFQIRQHPFTQMTFSYTRRTQWSDFAMAVTLEASLEARQPQNLVCGVSILWGVTMAKLAPDSGIGRTSRQDSPSRSSPLYDLLHVLAAVAWRSSCLFLPPTRTPTATCVFSTCTSASRLGFPRSISATALVAASTRLFLFLAWSNASP
ncbi:hypothetical protein GGTG_13439 [Gaeumannomyces tritici R3-111a-1]|uniref:Uncharacterized protein n=1 Tax=Gaeumannomyces tritici (strain R3-111a-1) TaxID=644352 RepID=J3PIV9_GAET3|nr:hypothetical protein GGTG_13439 [Gaeumannomyces tritici R3-111a-1]EJT69042.1 hypothetical protein GGTG_13439 [Gaeumannomyces tritici R3-111a-1]